MDGQMMNFGRDLTHPLMNMPDDPPPANAHYEERADWSERYVQWLIAQTPAEGALPADVSPTHRYQVEFTSCVMDPQKYFEQTQAELHIHTVH